MTLLNKNELEEIASRSIKETIERSGLFSHLKSNTSSLISENKSKTSISSTAQQIVEKAKSLLKEALIVLPKTFILKTDWLSSKTKETHERLYKNYAVQFNIASSKLDAANKEDIIAIRNLKLEETYNLNAVKLHELYFGNISDQQSEIHRDSIAYMRISRDWGSFENWQFDFRATCLASREGWAILYFDPFKDKYLHAMIDGHSTNIPVCCIPILVMDMWSHAYFKDYLDDKKSYINAMLRETNWNILEARMVIAERANLKDLYLVRPLVNSEPQKMLDLASNAAPIGKDQINPTGIEQIPAPGSEAQTSPKTMINGFEGR